MVRPLFIGFLYVFVLSCSNRQSDTRVNAKHKEQFYRFYDFNVNMEVYSPNGMLKSKYLILNSGIRYDDERIRQEMEARHSNNDILYYVSYQHPPEQYSNNTGRPIDTVTIPLEKPQLDSIYSLAVAAFDLELKTNLSNR